MRAALVQEGGGEVAPPDDDSDELCDSETVPAAKPRRAPVNLAHVRASFYPLFLYSLSLLVLPMCVLRTLATLFLYTLSLLVSPMCVLLLSLPSFCILFPFLSCPLHEAAAAATKPASCEDGTDECEQVYSAMSPPPSDEEIDLETQYEFGTAEGGKAYVEPDQVGFLVC